MIIRKRLKQLNGLTLMPDNVSDSNKGNKFSGKVIIEDWAGNFKKGYVFNKDGKIFNLNIQNENIERPKVQSNNVKVNDVYCISTPWYGQNISGGESFWYIGGYDTSCYSTGSPYEDNYINTGNELGGNHGETFPSDYVPNLLLPPDVACLSSFQFSMMNSGPSNRVSEVYGLFGALVDYQSDAVITPLNFGLRIEVPITINYWPDSDHNLAHSLYNDLFVSGDIRYSYNSSTGAESWTFSTYAEQRIARDASLIMLDNWLIKIF
jgi:hypothetical protein